MSQGTKSIAAPSRNRQETDSRTGKPKRYRPQRYLTTSPSGQLSSNTYTTLKTGAIEPRILSPEGLGESQRSPVLETGTISYNWVADKIKIVPSQWSPVLETGIISRGHHPAGPERAPVSMKSGLRDWNNSAGSSCPNGPPPSCVSQ